MSEDGLEIRDVNGQLFLEFDRPPLLLLTPDEIYDRADETLLRQLFEDSRLEIKPQGEHPEHLADYFAMWANTAPSGGLILIGINRNKTVEGCSSLSSKQINRLELTGETFCPEARCNVKRVEMRRDSDGARDCVLLFRVHYHPTRVIKTTAGRVWIRRADQKMEIKKPDDVRQLQSEKGEISFELEPCGLDYPKEFDQEAIREFVGAVKTKKGWIKATQPKMYSS